MKKTTLILLIVLLMLFLPTSGWCNDDAFFTDKTIEGIEMTFRITGPSTCNVSANDGYTVPIETTGVVTIPETVRGYTVVGIDDNVFRYDRFDNPGITQINIPETVEFIGINFCYMCYSLTKVFIPKSVRYIPGLSFYHCANIESIEVEKDNPVYDSRENCNAIIETANNRLFISCKNTFIPTSVTELDWCTFEQIPIEQITIPEGITHVPYRCFYWCWLLASVTLPESLQFIDSYAFYHTSLASVHIPKNVNYIGYQTFYDCSDLESISVAEDNTTYDSRGNCNAIIATKNDSLILGCKSTVIPEGVKVIGHGAFTLSLEEPISLIIPKSVTKIEYEAFNFSVSTRLQHKIVSQIEEPFEIDNKAFASAYHEYATLYVPKGTKEKYESTAGWNLFKSIIELDADGNIPDNIHETAVEANVTSKVQYNIIGQQVDVKQRGLIIVRMNDGTVKKVMNR